MNIDDFRQFRPYFSAREKWGDIDRIQWYHVHQLWSIRMALKEFGHDWPIIIHCCYEMSGHSQNSYHYKGLATDFHFKTDEDLKIQYWALQEALLILNLEKFCGLGLYPDWNNPGFHFDSRGYRIRWIYDKNMYIYGNDSISRYFKNAG